MRVFVTGATGFIGSHVVKGLQGAGHQVIALARSDDAASAAAALGADVHRGSLADTESLWGGAAAADAVIHLAFGADYTKFFENCQIDQQAIRVLGAALEGSGKPLIAVNGSAGLKPPGQSVTENDPIPADYRFPRASESTALEFVERGVRVSVIRLPQVHDTTHHGLVDGIIGVAHGTRTSAYVGEGSNRWAAAHVSDVAQLFTLVLAAGEAGAIYHASAEEGVSMRSIAEVIGRRLGVPVKSLAPEEIEPHFGMLAMFVPQDILVSSAITQKKLGWNPVGPGLIQDLEQLQ